MSCNHTFSKGTKSGQTCKKKPRGGATYCYKHSKTTPDKSERANAIKDDPIFNNSKTIVTTAAPKERYSVWLGTINSQLDYSKMTDKQKRDFKDFSDYLLNRDNLIRYLTDAKSPDDVNQNVRELSVEHYFEVGGSQNRLHLHFQLAITHTGHFSLECNKIREIAKKILGYNIYLNAPVQSDPVRAYAAYIKKMQDSSVVKL